MIRVITGKLTKVKITSNSFIVKKLLNKKNGDPLKHKIKKYRHVDGGIQL